MNYSQTDLDAFITMLVSLKQTIETNTKPHPYVPDHTRSIIIPQNKEMIYSLFPARDSRLLGLTENNNKSAYDKIYGIINTNLPGLGITYIDIRSRHPLVLEIEMKSNEDSKGGKKKRHTKKIKSTKKKRHIKKKNYTKKRR